MKSEDRRVMRIAALICGFVFVILLLVKAAGGRVSWPAVFYLSFGPLLGLAFLFGLGWLIARK